MFRWNRPDSLDLLGGHDAIEQAIVTAGRLLLAAAIGAILGGVLFVVIQRPFAAGHQGEGFYLTIAVLMALGWCIGQFRTLGRRR